MLRINLKRATLESNQHITQLYGKFLDNSINKEEYNELLQYFGADINREQLRQRIIQALEDNQEENIIDLHKDRIDQTIHHAREKIHHIIGARPEKSRSIFKLIPYIAAAILLVVGVFSYRYLTQLWEPQVQVGSIEMEDVDPGTNRATLTLDDGNTIALNEEQTGIHVGSDGISYMDGTKITENTRVQYAVLSTPRKGQYRTILPDGSRVWLNAESWLRYPTAFTENERRVELEGEGYFEVAHNIKQPFIVETASQQLKVLGTSFNLNAYDNEPFTVTTLVSGSIEVGSKRNNVVQTIRPAQQAALGTGGFEIKTIDVSPFVAWKEGEFRFKDTPLHEALRQVERWYDIEIDYTQIPKDIEIYAYIRRDKKLSSVLFALEKITDLKFTVKERRLMLME